MIINKAKDTVANIIVILMLHNYRADNVAQKLVQSFQASNLFIDIVSFFKLLII